MINCKMHGWAAPPRSAALLLVAICMSGCASRNPVDMIPAGVRATIQYEDRNKQTGEPVTVDSMLAKARGETPPPAAASPAPDQAPLAARKITVRFDPDAATLRDEEAQRFAGALLVLGAQPAPVSIALGPVGGAKAPGGPAPSGMTLIFQRQNSLRARIPAEMAARTEFRYAPTLTPDVAVLSAGAGAE